ncbi:MAG: LysR family transcriptional regulator [Polaromonas sp.]|uniref:LysR family transcriptional regulator n=1 Tax=Polaromonas sp. TaxID=1869339 RepID=UPI0027315C3D|nr:LysR family transcriptional regulator [Polaromonas sp.]MDP1743029.1 LysR family transcriptional regulator [Polaromonas sp.]MDP1954392.1 LysR family transcriptional regulator [Polaromonas sp.]
MDRLLSMRAFQQVVDDGGFSAAARTLGMSPAVMTRLITDLEQHLGARLLQRTTRKLSLTEAGQSYLLRVRHILNDVDQAEASTRQQTDELAGLLRIHTQPVMAVHIIAPLVAEFRRRYPNVVLDITVDSPLVPPIEDYDLTILGAGRLYDANVIARPVIVSEGLLCASPRYLRSAGTPRQPADLKSHALLRLTLPGIRQREWQLINPDEEDREMVVEIKPVMMANHSDTLLRATLDGTGISAQPLDLVANYLRDGQLRRVLAPWITGRFTLYAALPSRKYVPARARVFMEFLIEQTRLKAAEAERTWPSRVGQNVSP